MKYKTKEDLIEALIERKVDLKRIDSSVAKALEMYEINSAVALSVVLYTHLISFGFFETEEAVEMIGYLMETFSAYELNEIAKSALGADLVEFYKDIIFQDYSLSEGVLSKIMKEAVAALNISTEEFNEAMKTVEGLEIKDKE